MYIVDKSHPDVEQNNRAYNLDEWDSNLFMACEIAANNN